MVTHAPSQAVAPQSVTQALADAATAAGFAPSIHDTQPWFWRLGGEQLDLFLDRGRTLGVADPEDRLAILSCGAALNHALDSLAADGWRAAVEQLPDAGRAGQLATVRIEGRIPVAPEALRRARAVGLRHADRRPLAGARLDAGKLRSIIAVAESPGISLQLLRPGQVFYLATAADRAQRTQAGEVTWQAELQHWPGGLRRLGPGVANEAMPPGATAQPLTNRDFGPRSGLLIAEAHDRTAVYAILCGLEDRRLDWLRAGESLSAAWITAAELGVSVLPLSATIEVSATRDILRHLLAGAAYPFLVLRFGVLDPTLGKPPKPRPPAEQTIERC